MKVYIYIASVQVLVDDERTPSEESSLRLFSNFPFGNSEILGKFNFSLEMKNNIYIEVNIDRRRQGLPHSPPEPPPSLSHRLHPWEEHWVG